MTASQFAPERSNAIRSLIMNEIAASASSRRPTRMVRWNTKGIIAFVAAGAVTGGMVSAAASDLFWINRDAGGFGAPIVSVLDDGFTASGAGPEEISLPDAPAGATHLEVVFTCGTAGSFTWGTDPVNNPGSTCSASDIGTRSATGSFDFPLTENTDSFLVGTEPEDGRWQLSGRFIGEQATDYGINANGDTYGIGNDGMTGPDLVAVSGTDPEGQIVEGYARAVDLNAFGPGRPNMPSNPEEALAWQGERDKKYPNGWDIPIYTSDGITQIGEFHISN